MIGDDERERADVNLAGQRREIGEGKLVDAGDGTNFVSFLKNCILFCFLNLFFTENWMKFENLRVERD